MDAKRQLFCVACFDAALWSNTRVHKPPVVCVGCCTWSGQQCLTLCLCMRVCVCVCMNIQVKLAVLKYYKIDGDGKITAAADMTVIEVCVCVCVYTIHTRVGVCVICVYV